MDDLPRLPASTHKWPRDDGKSSSPRSPHETGNKQAETPTSSPISSSSPTLAPRRNMPATKFCVTCDKPTMLGCSRCQNISYCSVACQSSDWAIHSLLCWQFASFTEADRPTPWHIRAVIFPTRAPHPRFVWLLMTGRYRRDVSAYLGTDDSAIAKECSIDYMSRRRTVASQPLYLYYMRPESQGYRWRLLNASVPQLRESADVDGLFFPWRGPIIVTGEWGDVNARDFRAAVDMLLAHPKNLALVGTVRFQGHPVVGVKLNCDDTVAANLALGGSGARLERVAITEHMLAGHLPVFLRLFAPALPLVVRFAATSGLGQARARNPHCALFLVEERLFARREALVMAVDDIAQLRQGQDQTGLGTMVMHRADRRELLPVHVMALEEFVCAMAEVVADTQGRVWRDDLALHLRKEEFAPFWKEFLSKFGLNDEDEEPPSPFVM